MEVQREFKAADYAQCLALALSVNAEFDLHVFKKQILHLPPGRIPKQKQSFHGSQFNRDEKYFSFLLIEGRGTLSLDVPRKF